MTRQDLGNETTNVVADGAKLTVERVFDAPRELVWKAMTSPENVAAWWGRKGTTAEVAELDVRPGGPWRYITHSQDGTDIPFAGEFTDVQAPESFSRTSIFDVPPFNEMPAATETTTLKESDGATTMVLQSTFPAPEILQGALAEGMVDGTIEQYDRLAELLTRIA